MFIVSRRDAFVERTIATRRRCVKSWGIEENVTVAVFVIALTAIPVYLAQRLMRESGGIGGRG